ncbi:CotH kinase family protein [Fictibacillus sp. Mic-4]|uniref:CotH kinase family protein n=1 Tax=Fictibacillus sp. Mic-4 TaxID=3132826 RepID=UPI003CF5318A
MTEKKLPVYEVSVPVKGAKIIKSGKWAIDPIQGNIKVNGNSVETLIMTRGAHIFSFPKKSYDLLFTKNQPFFGERAIHLNAEYNDPSFMRNKLSFDFFERIGAIAPSSQHVLLYINGFFQGIYLHLDSVDKRFLEKRGLPDGGIFYAVDENANFSLYSPSTKKVKESLLWGYEQKYGTEEDVEALKGLMEMIVNASEEEFPAKVKEWFNVDNYLRWLAGVVCTQNFDGFIHNYALYRNRENGLFHILPWDYDATWGRDVHGDIMEYDYVPIKGYNTMTSRLLYVKEFRKQYQTIMEEVLEEHFTVDAMRPFISELYESLRDHVIKDPFKHRDLDWFDEEPEFIEDFITMRNQYLKDELKELN